MSDVQGQFKTIGQTKDDSVDQGLKQYFVGIYQKMAMALAVTGLVAFGVSQSPAALALIFGTPLKWVVMFAPLGMVLLLNMAQDRLSNTMVNLFFWTFSVVMGVSLASIFLVYKLGSIANIFFITSATFGGLSLSGYTTKRDLSGMRAFLFASVWGILIASMVNVFILKSSMFDLILSAVSVVIFSGLIAYETQNLKEIFDYMRLDQRGQAGLLARMTTLGALTLYVSFVNLFLSLLRLFGARR